MRLPKSSKVLNLAILLKEQPLSKRQASCHRNFHTTFDYLTRECYYAQRRWNLDMQARSVLAQRGRCTGPKATVYLSSEIKDKTQEMNSDRFGNTYNQPGEERNAPVACTYPTGAPTHNCGGRCTCFKKRERERRRSTLSKGVPTTLRPLPESKCARSEA